jgi:asparagine synthase (glutamine-hydrolysing)
MLALDVESYLVDNLVVRGDKMMMAASIEGRMPLLDQDLAEYAAQMPTRLKASPWRNKIVIREIARRRLPRSLLTRKKVGFAVPLASSFRGGMGDALERLMLGANARPDPLVVVPGQVADTADGRAADGGVVSVMVVAVEPGGQRLGALAL